MVSHAIHTQRVEDGGVEFSTSRGKSFALVAVFTTLLAVVGIPVGSGASAALPVGTVTHGTITFDGTERTFRLYVPSDLPEGPVPVFVGLHGGSGWGDQFATTNHIEELAESNHFIVVHPDGVKLANGRGGVWNGGVCCGIAAREGVDDVGFINTLLDELSSTYDVDAHRVFAFGHSNGGIMSYRLACELADRVVGIGVVAGTLGVEPCDPTQPVSVMHVHGTDDLSLPIAGGVGPNSRAGVDFPAPREGFATIASLDGCPDAEERTDGDVTVAHRGPCDSGAAAVFVTIATAGHPWPGGTSRVTPSSGDVYADYDATAELVEFLLLHPRP